jgi:hypothetical protein
MTNELTHVADVKVGKVKGKSRTYPQLRLPSEYIELVGKKASIYETSEHQGETTFIIRLNNENRVAAYNERAERTGASFACDGPCRGSDSGSNPDSGAPFLLLASM